MAKLYDELSSELYDYHAKRGDIEFYMNYALDSRGPVLELGCGTGRILIPTARAGIEVLGLDTSKPMLGICTKKLEGEPADVRARTKLIQADMRSFNLGRKFPLIVIAFGPFNQLLSVEEQLRCLSCVSRHLTDGGRLIFDLYYPKPTELGLSDGAEIFVEKTPFILPDARSVIWGIRYHHIDYNRQIIHEELFYDIRYPDGHEERLVYAEPIRYFFRFEVEHLLARAGFIVEAVHADFDKTAFGTKLPSELIFVARKEQNCRGRVRHEIGQL